MKLVIAEKPSVGAAIAAGMGADPRAVLMATVTMNNSVNGSTTIFPLSRRSGSLLLPAARSSSFPFSKTLCTAATLPRLSMLATAGARGNSFSALSMNRRIAKSPFPAFGLAAWKQVQSARAFQISKTGAAMTTSINPRFAEQRPIGSLALTRPAFSLSSTIKH